MLVHKFSISYALILNAFYFISGSHTVNIEMAFTKSFGAGFFGGEGFVLQKLTGEGDAIVKAGGALIRRELKEGEVLRVTSGCLVAFSSDIDYDVQMVKGFKNVVFGGEGLFLTTLRGPGTVFLQSLPFDRVVDQIARRMPSGGVGIGVPIMMGGGGGAGGGTAGGGDAGGVEGAGVAAGTAGDAACKLC